MSSILPNQPPHPIPRLFYSDRRKNPIANPHACEDSSFKAFTNLSRQPSHTFSKPPTTSPQTCAHSLLANLSPQFPLSSHLTPSSLNSSSLLISATTSLALLSFLAAAVVVCRDM